MNQRIDNEDLLLWSLANINYSLIIQLVYVYIAAVYMQSSLCTCM